MAGEAGDLPNLIQRDSSRKLCIKLRNSMKSNAHECWRYLDQVGIGVAAKF